MGYEDFGDWIKVDVGDTPPVDLTNAFDAAVAYVEKVSWIALSQRTIKFVASEWGDYEFDLDMGGVLGEGISCSYYNTSNVSANLAITDSWLERTGFHTSTLHVVAASYPDLYDRSDAIRITLTVIPDYESCPEEIKIAVYMLAAYFYDCRVNDKEPVLTIVDKIVASVRQKEY